MDDGGIVSVEKRVTIERDRAAGPA